MRIVKVNIQNFLALAQAELRMDGRGLLLIQGANDDDPSANSNGAGKSSIPDAICWALYGKTARGISGDAVINTSAKKNTVVELAIEDDGEAYYVARYRKHTREKSRLHVSRVVSGDKFGDGQRVLESLTQGTDKLTQEVVDRIIGCSYEVFTSAVYAGQEQMPNLPAMTDKQLKLLIEEAAGVTRLEAAYKIARDALREETYEISALQQELRGVCDMIEAYQTDVERLKSDEENFEEQRKKGLADFDARIKLADEQRKEFRAKFLAIDEVKIDRRLAEYQAQLDGHKSENEQLARLDAALNGARQTSAATNAQLQMVLQQARDAKKRVDDVDSQVGQPCSECGKLYRKEDLTEVRKRMTVAAIEIAQRAKTLQADAQEAARRSERVSEERNKFQATMTDVSEVLRLQSDTAREKHALEQLRVQHSSAVQGIESLRSQRKELEGRKNPYIALGVAKVKQIEELACKQQEIEGDIKKRSENLHLINGAVDIYGPAGVRAHILDTVTPFLNDRTAHYLGTLSDGNIYATWSTIGKTAKGDLREKFNIDVVNEHGAKSFAGLSGGEKRKVRLACALALQDLVASRAVKPIDIWIGDEIDDALDVSGLERLMSILEEKAREKGTVLVISHNELTDWCRQSIVVRKSGGKSIVEV